VAIVTGPGAGNGRAIAQLFAAEGARVTCADLDGSAARAVAEGIAGMGGQAIAVQMDHTIAADCERTVAAAQDAFGVTGVLVNNAGVAMMGTALDVTEEDLLRQLRINVVGPFLMARAVLPGMIAAGAGSIVMIASAAGLQARQSGAPYVTSKHAVIGLTRSLAADYARHGVRVNAVCPGLVRTSMSEAYLEYRARKLGASVEQVAAEVAQEFPLGRLGRPEDVAAATLHFASDESSWVTGETYLLDGGQVLLGPRRTLPSEPPTGSS
jgi:NAD(P)-dependent dehydrogenase (short-subunit alcohol dehydrogenase family)